MSRHTTASDTAQSPSVIRSLSHVATAARERRKALRLTQRDLARAAGVSRDTVVVFEKAALRADGSEGTLEQDLSFERVVALLSVLGLNLFCVGGARAEGAAEPAQNVSNQPACPSVVEAFDPEGAARLRWAGESEAQQTRVEALELTEAQIATLRELAAAYVWWIPADEAARKHPSRVLAQAMDVRETSENAPLRARLIECFSVEVLGRALRHGRANGWFPGGGDERWEAFLAGVDEGRAEINASRF